MALNLFNFDYLRPSQILDQHFGMDLSPEDLLSPLSLPYMRACPMLRPRYFRPWKIQNADQGSTVKYDKDRFQVIITFFQSSCVSNRFFTRSYR